MDALERLSNHRSHAEQYGALRGPVTRRSRTVLFTGENDERGALFLEFHRRVVDELVLPALRHRGPSALGARGELVLETNVGESSAHHYFVVAAAGSVGIEVFS